MTNVQLENGYTKIANEFMDALCRFRIPGGTRQVIDCIFRKTYGWNKKEDWVSHSQIVYMTDMKKGNVSRELSKAITHKIVIVSDNKLKLNKNYEEWISFGGKHFNPKQKLSDAITGVIVSDTKVIVSEGNKRNYTKDTTTKEISTNVLIGFGNPDINELSSYFLRVFQLPKEDCSKSQSRQYWHHLLQESKTGVQGVKWLIDQAYQDEWYKNNITSSKDLYYKRIKIIARKRGNAPRVATMPKEVT